MRSVFSFVCLLFLGLSSAQAQLVSAGYEFFDQSDLGNLVEAGDRFGASLTAGDFDNDGYDDLAIGLPGEDIGAVVDAGSILVVYGGLRGPQPGAAFAAVDSSKRRRGSGNGRDRRRLRYRLVDRRLQR